MLLPTPLFLSPTPPPSTPNALLIYMWSPLVSDWQLLSSPLLLTHCPCLQPQQPCTHTHTLNIHAAHTFSIDTSALTNLLSLSYSCWRLPGLLKVQKYVPLSIPPETLRLDPGGYINPGHSLTVIWRNKDKEKQRVVSRRHKRQQDPKAETIHPLCSILPPYPNASTFWLFGNLVPERCVCESQTRCRWCKRDCWEPMVAEVKVLPTFAYRMTKQGEARQRSIPISVMPSMMLWSSGVISLGLTWFAELWQCSPSCERSAWECHWEHEPVRTLRRANKPHCGT